MSGPAEINSVDVNDWEFERGYQQALRSFDMVTPIPSPNNNFEHGWNAYANEMEN